MPSSTRPRILVVDDDPVLVQMVTMYLTVEGYEVATATDGEEALQAMDVARPDLVLLDVMMAGMDGIATCRAIKGREGFEDVPVVMFTALGRHDDEMAGRAAGADRYLAKPFSLVGLGAVVRGQLADRSVSTAV